MAVIPMFPLGMVLLPGGVLPLHVFEPRYRQMVVDCLRQDGEPEFGQALITHGSEAGGGDERAMVGTIAQMIKVEALDEERYSMVTVGTRRIRVSAWLPDEPYPLADVDDWPDEDPDPPALVATYHLASLAPIGPADRHRLLCASGPAARLDLLDEVLDDVEAMLKFRLH